MSNCRLSHLRFSGYRTIGFGKIVRLSETESIVRCQLWVLESNLIRSMGCSFRMNGIRLFAYSILPLLFEVVSGTEEEVVAKISINKHWNNVNFLS
jgi:hypothetical protein